MPKTIVRENETIEDALKRFKRDVSRSGTLAELRKREHYLKPSDVRKMKKRALKNKLKRLPLLAAFLITNYIKFAWHSKYNKI